MNAYLRHTVQSLAVAGILMLFILFMFYATGST